MNRLFNSKQQEENKRLGEMSPEKYEKAVRGLSYQDKLQGMQQRPVMKPKAGEFDSGSYDSYMDEINRLKAGVKAGGDFEKQEKILSKQRSNNALEKRYGLMKEAGFVVPDTFEEFYNDEIGKQKTMSDFNKKIKAQRALNPKDSWSISGGKYTRMLAGGKGYETGDAYGNYSSGMNF